MKPEFDAEHVYKIFKEVLVDRNDFYKKNMLRLQKISMAQKGRETAARIVEQTAVFGLKPVVDEALHQKRQYHNFFSSYLLLLFIIGVLWGNYHYIFEVNKTQVSRPETAYVR